MELNVSIVDQTKASLSLKTYMASPEPSIDATQFTSRFVTFVY